MQQALVTGVGDGRRLEKLLETGSFLDLGEESHRGLPDRVSRPRHLRERLATGSKDRSAAPSGKTVGNSLHRALTLCPASLY